jgi:hypothetical protein
MEQHSEYSFLFEDVIDILSDYEQFESANKQNLKNLLGRKYRGFDRIMPSKSIALAVSCNTKQVVDLNSAISTLNPHYILSFTPFYQKKKDELFDKDVVSLLDEVSSKFSLETTLIHEYPLYFDLYNEAKPSEALARANDFEDFKLLLQSKLFSYWLSQEEVQIKMREDVDQTELRRLGFIHELMYPKKDKRLDRKFNKLIKHIK